MNTEIADLGMPKVITTREVSGHRPADHFADVGKTIQMSKDVENEVIDLMFTRYLPHPVGSSSCASRRLLSSFPGLPRLVTACFAYSHNTRVSFGEAVWGRLFGAGPCLFLEVVS